MGRGEGADAAAAAGATALARSSSDHTADDLDALLGLGEIGDLARDRSKLTRISSRAEWKKRESEYAENTFEKLRDAVTSRVKNKTAWEAYLKLYGLSPKYSAQNQLFAWGRLSRYGIRRGMILSESDWAALGRRVKAEFADPLAKGAARRDKKFGYDRDREWDSRYACEMFRPYGHLRTRKDANGDPITDANGEEQKYLHVTGYAAFLAYHEDATEALDGGAPPPLPPAPWEGVSSEDGAPEKLVEDLKTKMLQVAGVSQISQNQPAAGKVAEWVNESYAGTTARRLAIDSDASEEAQAIGILRALCEGDAQDPKVEATARESAVLVIASLYGVDNTADAFPHLKELLDDGKHSTIAAETHKRVSKVLGVLDPRLKKLKESSEAAQKEYKEKRKRSQKKGAKTMKKALEKNSQKPAPQPAERSAPAPAPAAQPSTADADVAALLS